VEGQGGPGAAWSRPEGRSAPPRVQSPDRAAGRRADLCGVTHVGRVRRENQDHFLIARLGADAGIVATSLPPGDAPRFPSTPVPGDVRLLAVADGVRGGPGGEEASRTALRLLPLCVSDALAPGESAEGEAERLTRAVRRMHAHFLEIGRHRLTLRGMATTLTAWIELPDRAWLIQVGDSRCYRLRDGRLTRLSRDQTLAQRMVDQGVARGIEEAPPGWTNVLTSALGGHQLEPEVTRSDPGPDDTILVCSDGLTKHLTDPEIESILGDASDAGAACRSLVDGSLAEGGTDNVAVVIRRPGG